ncbi:hypothetical protein BJV78DRAFT_339553 [Lactifluus subvellereus]|nr:hypothetical protein BJV78DRAFT_339553 [Lactifluus subvellereus]
MVNYRDPAVERADFYVFVKLIHVVDGVYLWEYFSTLWYEWSFITRKQPYRWSIWIYAGTRLTTLMNVLTNLIGLSLEKAVACQPWFDFQYITAYTALALGSFIMILRINAIWDGHRWVLVASIGAWLTNIVLMIRSLIITPAYWKPALLICAPDDIRKGLANITSTLCSELFLLLVMIAGLVRQRDHYIGRLLFKQGLIWFVVAVVAEVPPAVLLYLNLSDPWNVMFQTPGLIIMTICVTRMHRGLNAIRDHQAAPKIPEVNLSSGAPTGIDISSNSDRSIELQTAVRVAMSSHSWQPSDTSDDTPRKSTSTAVAGFRGSSAV